MTHPLCRHCNNELATRPRGLGWQCYYAPGVRALYPVTSKYALHGVGNLTGVRPLPAAPTAAMPGTPEKMAVLAERARLGQRLWHPADAVTEPPPAPVFIPEVTVHLNGRRACPDADASPVFNV